MSTPEDQIRASLAALDVTNQPILDSAAAGLVTAQNGISGSSASWKLVLACQQFTLKFGTQTTPTISVTGLTAAALQADLQALSSIGGGNCAVALNQDGSYAITLAGALANTTEAANQLTGTVIGTGTLTITQTNPGNPQAGADQAGAIASAAASFSSALTQDAAFRSTVQSDLTGTGTDVTATGLPIGHITSPSAVPSVGAGSGDCLAADVNTAIGSMVTKINAAIDALNVALNALKDAASKLQDVGQQFLNQIPAGADTEAEKSSDLQFIQNLMP
jgi:hypothetical protein